MIGVLQALRLALFQHMFLKVVMVPAFSRANDITRDDVMEMVFTLRVDEALAQLKRAFPTSFPSLSDFKVDEPADYPDDARAAMARSTAIISIRWSGRISWRCASARPSPMSSARMGDEGLKK
jgi:hypothetical protein